MAYSLVGTFNLSLMEEEVDVFCDDMDILPIIQCDPSIGLQSGNNANVASGSILSQKIVTDGLGISDY